jgi:putative FmdB family regulatory protein
VRLRSVKFYRAAREREYFFPRIYNVPVYEYRCTQCEHQFELWQEVGAEAPACEKCGAEVRKIFHPVRTIYKGSGFYITDTRAEKSKSSGGASSDKASTPAESKSEATSTSSTESASSTPASTPSAPAKSENK